MEKGAQIASSCWHGLEYKDNLEAKGYLKLAASRGCFTVFGALYATLALNELALNVQDCDGNILNGSLKASSAIAVTVFIDAAFNAVISPFWGVLGDLFVHQRKAMYIVSHATWLLMVIVQMILVSVSDPEDSYIFIFIATAVIGSLGLELSIVLLVSYLPEIAPDTEDVAKITGRGFAWTNGMQLFLALGTTAIGFATGIEDASDLALVAGTITALVWLYFTVPGFQLLKGRTKRDEPNKDLCSTFTKTLGLFKDSFTKYKQIGLFLTSYMFFFAGVGNVVALATQFLLAAVGLQPFLISVITAILLVVATFSALFIHSLIDRFDLKKAYLMIITFWLVLSVTGPFAMQGSVVGEQNQTDGIKEGCPEGSTIAKVEPADGAVFIVLMYGIMYGAGIGIAFGLAQTLYIEIIPGGDESGYFGLKVVASKLLSWAPSLAFTAINESFDDATDIAFLCVAPFFLIGLVIGFFIDVEKGKEDIKDTLHKRQMAGNRMSMKVLDAELENATHSI